MSGTAPIGDDGESVCLGDLYGQTLRCLEIIESAIQDAGGSLASVVRTRVMLTNIVDWKEAARAHGEYFGEVCPSCTFVEVSRFIDAEWLVEIEADAVVD